jgi:hypothetical protein
MATTTVETVTVDRGEQAATIRERGTIAVAFGADDA